MRIPRLQIPNLLILAVVAAPHYFGDDRRAAVRADEVVKFVLEVNRHGGLTLDGREIAREDLVREAARLAERVRTRAREPENPTDPKHELPAVIVFRADGATPFSTIYPMAMDCQTSGFRRWSFALRAEKTGATPARHPEEVVAPPPREKSDLPAALRTIPILLRSDDRRMIGTVEVGEREFQGFEPLRAELVAIMKDPDLPFDQALLKVDARLRYSELTRVLDLLTRLNIKAIHFSLAESRDIP